MVDIVSLVWTTVGICIILVLVLILPILIEIRKTIKSYRIISERIEMLTDIKSWFGIFKSLKKDNK